MAKDIVSYVAKDLRSPEGGFYSAEDADSLPTRDSAVKKEGAFYVWTAKQLDELLQADAEMFKYHFGVRPEGNCDPRHDIQGELRGQVRVCLRQPHPLVLELILWFRTFCSRRTQRRRLQRSSESRSRRCN